MKRLLIEYRMFVSRVEEIEEYLIKVDRNSTIEKISSSIPNTDADISEYLDFIRSLGNSPLSYNAIIISLYGCFENYVDKLFGVYLEILTESKSTYEELPAKLREKYRNKFGEFLSNPQRFNNMELDFSDEITKYYKLLQSDLAGTINKNIALSHSGNLHVEEVFLLMKQLGIKDAKERIMDSHVFKKYHFDNGMDEVEFDEKRARKTDDFFFPLEQLITQRNSVAHSWNVEDRVTLREIKNSIIPFIKLLCNCVLRICLASAYLLNSNTSIFQDEQPIAVYNNSIVCFNNQGVKITKGDYIIYVSDENVKVAQIENMQFDRKDIVLVEETDSKKVGLKLDNTIKKEDKLKFLINAM